ncbi:hypothetical protein ABGB17_29065 [Sphaerisporangium sp. B11E5]|uniref:hypothetical protein n=1 Tax=Sphaerisporangium sp. B11E5 TaxID=3153563 RepID=UPI00325EEB41
MEPIPTGKESDENSVTGTAAIGSRGVLRDAATSGGPALERGSQALTEVPTDPRAFAVGDRVRVVNPQWKLYSRSGTISRRSATKPDKWAVDFQGEAMLNRFVAADLNFDVKDVANELFPKIYTAHPEKWIESLVFFLRGLTDPEWAQIPVDVPARYIRHMWGICQGVLLRYTRDPAIKALAVGCGNTPLPSRKQNLACLQGGHRLDAAYTVDPEIDLGPTVLGLFGRDPVHKAFLSNHFLAIVYCGYTPLTHPDSLGQQRHLLAAFRHLLRDEGVVRFPIGPEQRTATILAALEGRKLIVKEATVAAGEKPPIGVDLASWTGDEVTEEWLARKLTDLAKNRE